IGTIEGLEIDGKQRILRGAAETLRAPAAILAAGSALRTLGIPGEAQFLGRGVSHCASCDGPLFAGRKVCAVGGGDAAFDEALVLAAQAAHVTLFHRGGHVRAQQALQYHVAATTNIAIVLHTVVEEILGADMVSAVRLRGRDDAARVHPISGVFVYVGLEPNTAFLSNVITLDAAGHIEVDLLMRT